MNTESLLDAIIVIKGWSVLYINSFGKDLFEISQSDISSGIFLNNFISPQSMTIFLSETSKMNSDPGSCRIFESGFISKNKKFFTARIICIQIIYQKSSALQLIVTKIPELHHLQVNNTENYRKYFEIMQKSENLIFVLNYSNTGNLTIYETNEKTRKVLGFDADELSALNFLDLFDHFSAESIPFRDEKTMKKFLSKKSISFESLLISKHGHRIPVYIDCKIISLNHQHNIIMIANDISDKKFLEKKIAQKNSEIDQQVNLRTAKLEEINNELNNSYSLLSSILESPENIIIFALDQNYCYTAYNKNHKNEMYKIWGKKISIGTCMLDLILDDDDKKKAITNFNRALNGERFTLIEEYGNPPNRYYYEDIYNPIFDSNHKIIGLTVFLTDITKRKKAELEVDNYRNHLETIIGQRTKSLNDSVRLLRKEIEEKAKIVEEREKLITELEVMNTELERYAYTVSHDLKNPLVTIRGFTGFIEKEYGENAPDQFYKDLDHIKAATDKMLHLLDDLLEFSRAGKLNQDKEPIELSQLVDEIISVINVDVNYIRIKVNFVPENIRIFDVKAHVYQVFENLISNAVKYIGDQKNPMIVIGNRVIDSKLYFYVQDNGIGINPKYHEKIFNLFDQLDPDSPGTGVGLSIVKRIIELKKGKIWVENNEIENGSVFLFTGFDILDS